MRVILPPDVMSAPRELWKVRIQVRPTLSNAARHVAGPRHLADGAESFQIAPSGGDFVIPRPDRLAVAMLRRDA
jgi:hypothetical protein